MLLFSKTVPRELLSRTLYQKYECWDPFQGQLLVVKGNKINLLEKKSELGMEQSRREVYNEYMKTGFDIFTLSSLLLL